MSRTCMEYHCALARKYPSLLTWRKTPIRRMRTSYIDAREEGFRRARSSFSAAVFSSLAPLADCFYSLRVPRRINNKRAAPIMALMTSATMPVPTLMPNTPKSQPPLMAPSMPTTIAPISPDPSHLSWPLPRSLRYRRSRSN